MVGAPLPQLCIGLLTAGGLLAGSCSGGCCQRQRSPGTPSVAHKLCSRACQKPWLGPSGKSWGSSPKARPRVLASGGMPWHTGQACMGWAGSQGVWRPVSVGGYLQAAARLTHVGHDHRHVSGPCQPGVRRGQRRLPRWRFCDMAASKVMAYCCACMGACAWWGRA
jgi:hypothetical protein